jgi:hypothetical protein
MLAAVAGPFVTFMYLCAGPSCIEVAAYDQTCTAGSAIDRLAWSQRHPLVESTMLDACCTAFRGKRAKM